MNKQGITIRTVAKAAGVGISTVSRFLNTPESVSDSSRDRIAKVVRDLHFIPNPVARALGGQKIENVAVVVPNIVNPVMPEIVRGIIDELDKLNITVLLYDCAGVLEREKRFIQALPTKMIGGVILVSDCGRAVEYSDVALSMPVVLVDWYSSGDGLPSVKVDDLKGMGILVDHLVDAGHRRIALLAGDADTPSSGRRVEAFHKAMKARALSPQEDLIEYCPWSMRGGYEGLLRILDRESRPTALVCSSDVIAFGSISAARSVGIRVPDDLAITGFDNSLNGAFSSPTLTTLSFPSDRMGRMAARFMVDAMGEAQPDGLDYQDIALPLELIIRESTGSAA